MTPGSPQGPQLMVVDATVAEQVAALTDKVDELLKRAEKMRKEESSPAYDFGFMRVTQILELIPVTRPTWWKWVHAGIAPQGVKMGRNIRVWSVEEIRAFVAKISAGGLEEEAV